jgi:hypothetical protein
MRERMDPDYDYDDEGVEGDESYEEYFDEEAEEPPEPMSFPDAYSAAAQKPVALVVPSLPEAYASLKGAKEARFPARRVAAAALALAQALKAAALAALKGLPPS